MPFGCGRKQESEREESRLQLQSAERASRYAMHSKKRTRQSVRERAELKELKSAPGWQRFFFWVKLRLQPVLHETQLNACMCACALVRVCVGGIRQQSVEKCDGPPIDPSFYYRECASVQVCTHTYIHTYVHMCRYVCM